MKLDDVDLAVLAKIAKIHLTGKERAGLTPRLAGLLGDANEVNAFMAPRREVGPGVRFKHLDLLEEGDL
jgi:hypothetical protein